MDAAGSGSAWRERCSRTSRAWAAAGALDTWATSCPRSTTSRIRDNCPPPRAVAPVVRRFDGSMNAASASVAGPATDKAADTVTVGTGPLSLEDVVAVARHDARVELSAESAGRGRAAAATVIEALADDTVAALRRLHRLRRARHPAHPDRAARPAAALAGALARRRRRPRGRARGRARAHAPAHLDARHRPHRRPRGDARDVRRDAQRRHHPGRARVRLARLLRRPRPAVALRAGRSWARGRARRRRQPRRRADALRGSRDHARRAARRRRAWPSSTAPTACSACSSWPSPTCACCSRSPTSRRR